MSHDHSSAHAEHEEHHIVPWQTYFATFLVLLGLMVLTIVASKWNLGAMNNLVAMAIAVTKASAVVLIFMGVKYQSKLVWLWASIGFIWFLLLFGISLDYVSRKWEPTHGWEAPTHYNPQ